MIGKIGQLKLGIVVPTLKKIYHKATIANFYDNLLIFISAANLMYHYIWYLSI